MSSPWYEKIDPGTRLTQGELIAGCPLLVLAPPEGDGAAAPDLATPTLSARIEQSVAIVLSQDCDLQQSRVRHIVLCPCLTEDVYKPAWIEARQRAGRKHGESAWESHRHELPTTSQVNLMLLDPWPPSGGGVHLIVDLYEVHMLPRDWLEPAVLRRGGDRWLLRQPYLQRLASKFGTLYSRVAADAPVGLP